MTTNAAAPPLVVHIIYALDTGGLENGLVNIINRMPADRYRHAIICLTSAGEFSRRITADNVPIIPLHKRAGHDFGLYVRLYRELKRLRPTIVHTRNLASLEMQFVAALFPGIRRVHGEHGRDTFDLEGKNKRYNLLRRVVAPFVHRYIAVSKDLAEWLIEIVRIPAAKIRQIYNGVDQDKFTPPVDTLFSTYPEGAPPDFFPDNCLVIGTVGRLAAVKNQLLLIQAFSGLLNRIAGMGKNLRLVIVGDGPLRIDLEKAATRMAVADQVWFTGDRDDVPAFFHAMDIFVLPSLGEGVSNTVLEAMASGLPIVATEVGGSPELVTQEQNGLLVPSGNQMALVEALERLVRDRILRELMGKQSLRRVSEGFSWRKAVNEYMSVYDELCEGI